MKILLAKFRVKENPALRPPLIKGLQMLAKFRVKEIPALRPPLIKGLQMLAKFRVKENSCLTSAPYQGAPNASKISSERKSLPYIRPLSRGSKC